MSFDVELAWGALEVGTCYKKEADNVYINTTKAFEALMEFLDDLEVPATFAFVGGMLEHSPKDLKIDHLPSSYKDMISNARKTLKHESLFDRTMFERVMKSRINHDIAGHSYVHARVGRDDIDENVSFSEMDLSYKALAGEGVNPVSYIYPVNEIGYTKELKRAGFRTYRYSYGIREGRKQNILVSRLIRQFDTLGPGAPPSSIVGSEDNNILSQSSSLNFSVGPRKRWLTPLLKKRAIRGINMAEHDNYILHLWCHPFNFAEVPELLDSLKRVLHRAVKMRDSESLDIVTMKDFIGDEK